MSSRHAPRGPVRRTSRSASAWVPFRTGPDGRSTPLSGCLWEAHPQPARWAPQLASAGRVSSLLGPAEALQKRKQNGLARAPRAPSPPDIPPPAALYTTNPSRANVTNGNIHCGISEGPPFARPKIYPIPSINNSPYPRTQKRISVFSPGANEGGFRPFLRKPPYPRHTASIPATRAPTRQAACACFVNPRADDATTPPLPPPPAPASPAPAPTGTHGHAQTRPPRSPQSNPTRSPPALPRS